MSLLTKFLLATGAVMLLVIIFCYLGLSIMPKPFDRYQDDTEEPKTFLLPAGLPEPVDRFYQVALDGRIPIIHTAVITGRGYLRLGPVRFPARWRFTHQAGQGYRHYIETTIFGRPLMKVNEHYLDGRARFQLPMGVTENEPKLDMSANLALWGEAIFFPSIYLTDERVHWEPIDNSHARLVVPFGTETDSFTVSFDIETGLLKSIEALRWKEVTSLSKTSWRVDVTAWNRFEGFLLPSQFTITWDGEPSPWYVAEVEEIIYNAEVSEYLRAVGP